MNRRQFCRSAAAAGMAAAYPWSVLATEANTNISAISLDGDEIDLERAAIRELVGQLNGPLLLANDPQYDAARRIWNGMHDKHPALIAQCLSSDDVRHAIDFARERRLLTAVRGGGHSWPGKSVCEGGLMIDLSRMNDVKVEADIAVERPGHRGTGARAGDNGRRRFAHRSRRFHAGRWFRTPQSEIWSRHRQPIGGRDSHS